MSENYGPCYRCRGRGSVHCPTSPDYQECPRCGGTGFEGSAEAFLYQEAQKEDCHLNLGKHKFFVISGENNAK